MTKQVYKQKYFSLWPERIYTGKILTIDVVTDKKF